MLSISAPLDNAEYVLSQAQINYYTGGGEPLGKWFGGGAETLGLSGTVNPEVLRQTFQGRSPDGRDHLVQNAGAKNRQCGWDLTFSAGKSVSLAWAISAPGDRQAIEEAHEAAVRRALKFIESEAIWTRRGKEAERLEKVTKLVFALFQHGTSRAGDPQLHTHCLLHNVGIRDDGTSGSIVTKELFRLKMIGGLIYRQELGFQLNERLGFRLVREKTWLQIEGVPADVCEAFSKRRAQVLEHLDKMGKSDAVSAAAAAKATRSAKELVPRESLFKEWAAFAAEKFSFTHDSVRALRHPKLRQPVDQHLEQTVSRLLEQESFFDDRRFLRQALELTQATGRSVDQVLTAVGEKLRTLVPLGIHKGRPQFTTTEVFQMEEELFRLAAEGRTNAAHKIPVHKLPKSERALSESQRKALRHAVSEDGDVVLIQGLAGTGKSSLLKTATEAWRKSGFTVLGAAYSGKAADGLAESAAITAHTVDRLLFQWSKDRSAVKPLDRKSILVVDEAGMLGTRRMLTLVQVARDRGAKLVFVGDEKQLPPIAAGAPFSELGRFLGRSELTEIKRQKNYLLRLVVERLAEGDVRKAIHWLKHDELLQVRESENEAKDALVRDWYRAGKPRNTIMLAGTREEVADLNRRAQSMLGRRLKILMPMFRQNGATFHIGERVLFRRNDRLLGVRNGSLGEFKAFNPLNRIATIALDNGKTAYVPIDKYKHLDLGYCFTTHKAQGMTVDNTFVLWSDSMQSREMTYVQASRSRFVTRFYLTRDQAGDDFEFALADMERSVAKELATTKRRSQEQEHERQPDRSPGISPSL